MQKKVCVASLYFNPSFVSLLAAFGKAFREAGSEVGYVLDPKYESFGDLRDVAPVSYYGHVTEEVLDTFTHVLIYNASIPNPLFALKMKRRGCKVAYVYHEPRVPLGKVWGKLGFGNIARLAVSRIFSRLTLYSCDLIVLPSREAWNSYQLCESRYNSNMLEMPLIFDDGYQSLSPQPRTKFSYIGTISHAHAFDQFLAFMRYALRENLGIEFLIASRHEVPASEIPEEHRGSVVLRCGRPLTSDEINECYAQSLCVWNLYRHSTQSAVMASAFMCGAPVLASRTGAFLDFVRDGYNGKFADGSNFEEVAAAFREIAAAASSYSENSRRTFETNFYYKSQLSKIEQILAQVEVP
jgi:glycosyltransferase involved in cell wall biosynthesis